MDKQLLKVSRGDDLAYSMPVEGLEFYEQVKQAVKHTRCRQVLAGNLKRISSQFKTGDHLPAS